MSLIISNAFTESQKTSKELYTEKLKLITSAKDMSTAEKLTAMNDSYSTWYQQNWQNVRIICQSGYIRSHHEFAGRANSRIRQI